MTEQNRSTFLPGIPENLVRAALLKAGGNEVASGKLDNPNSSAALAVNTFGFFLERPELLPALPSLKSADWPPVRVDIERQMRFPWNGGRHPWLDAAVETTTAIVGVESKRYEPFRGPKPAKLSPAYDREVWGDRMAPYSESLGQLRGNPRLFRYLDASQLIKHAFGLVTEGRRIGKKPILFYLFAEPKSLDRRPISETVLTLHRQEIDKFAEVVAGAEVEFLACSYREWLETWRGEAQPHAEALISRFNP